MSSKDPFGVPSLICFGLHVGLAFEKYKAQKRENPRHVTLRGFRNR